MESCIPNTAQQAQSAWTFPAWVEQHQLPDLRFAQAYDALGDDRRCLLKGLIARHYALNPPCGAPASRSVEGFELVERSVCREPVPFVLLLLDGALDAPSLFLSALVPALCARVPQVLAARLGPKADAPDPLLVACELAGLERVAALGPQLMQRLLGECAASGLPGLVLHPESPEFRKLLSQKELRQALDASPLRLAALRAPRNAGVWRDDPKDFPPEILRLFFGALPMECGGAEPGEAGGAKSAARKPAPGTSGRQAFAAFASTRRDLLLAPLARLGATPPASGAAEVTASGACLGMWRWRELPPGIFTHERLAFTAP
jgi:hypothetical protein